MWRIETYSCISSTTAQDADAPSFLIIGRGPITVSPPTMITMKSCEWSSERSGCGRVCGLMTKEVIVRPASVGISGGRGRLAETLPLFKKSQYSASPSGLITYDAEWFEAR